MCWEIKSRHCFSWYPPVWIKVLQPACNRLLLLTHPAIKLSFHLVNEIFEDINVYVNQERGVPKYLGIGWCLFKTQNRLDLSDSVRMNGFRYPRIQTKLNLLAAQTIHSFLQAVFQGLYFSCFCLPKQHLGHLHTSGEWWLDLFWQPLLL